MRAPCEPPKTSRCGSRTGRRSESEELRADGNAGDFAVAEPACSRGKVDGGGLHALAHEAIGQAGHGVGLEGHGGDFELKGRGHGRAGGVAAHAEDDAGPELANEAAAGEDAARQMRQRCAGG